jgi:hypothetical protein
VTPITQKINYGIGLVSYLSRKLQIYLIFFCKDCKLILNLVNRFSFECLVFLKLLGLVFVCHFIFMQTLLKVFNVLKMHQYLFTPLFICRTKFTDLTTLRPLKLAECDALTLLPEGIGQCLHFDHSVSTNVLPLNPCPSP